MLLETLTDNSYETDPRAPKRRAWLAFLMSLILPGWGQFYCGYATRGLICYLAIATYGLGFMHWHSPWIKYGVKGFIVAWSLVLLGYLLVATEAAVSARKYPRGRPYQKWWCYILAYVLVTLVVNTALPLITDTFRVTLAVKPFSIMSGSMIPSLEPGDLALVDMQAYRGAEPRAFEPVILSYPDETDRENVARIVACPGDTLGISQGKLYRNGDIVGGAYSDIQGELEETAILPGHVFVMGDNVNNSKDSRYRGQVPIELVKGRVMGIVWPPGRARDFHLTARPVYRGQRATE